MTPLDGYNFERKILTDEHESIKYHYNEKFNFKGTECKKIYFKNCTFEREVDFSDIRAHDVICFIDCTFNENAIFTHGHYEQGIVVKGCIFKKDVHFNWCSFRRFARFWKTNFEGKANFNQSNILTGGNPDIFVIEGELNMSYCCFSSDAYLSRLEIKGPAYFWRTVFKGDVDFLETHFQDSAVFEGNPSDICISSLELNDPKFFEQLLNEGLLKLDVAESSSQKFDGNIEQLYAHLSDFTNLEDFERKVKEKIKEYNFCTLKERCEKYYYSMFDEKKDIKFLRTSFSAPEKVKFQNVSLKGVKIAELALQSVKFENIEWHSSRIFLFKKRISIFDELDEKVDYKHLSQIYNKLKVSFTKIGMYEEARDFHCGELEMKRKASNKAWKRLVTLETYYKFIGYGEYAIFPFLWLMITIFGLFPFLYMLTKYYNCFVDSLIHTLEISTFLKSPEKSEVPYESIRILDGVLRILLALEITMFLLPLKKQIDNK